MSGGIVPKLLIKGIDNYDNIIVEYIGFPKRRYNRFLIKGQLSIGCRQVLSNTQYIDFMVFTSRSFSKLPIIDWGFYENLSVSQSFQIGIQVKYFFEKIHLFGKESKN